MSEDVWALFNQRVAKLKGYLLPEQKEKTTYQKRQVHIGYKFQKRSMVCCFVGLGASVFKPSVFCSIFFWLPEPKPNTTTIYNFWLILSSFIWLVSTGFTPILS
jgi:hypothetical protein